MEKLFVVIWKLGNGKWKPLADGVCEERSHAELLIKAEQIKGSEMQYSIVEGPIVSAESMAEAEARLGPFYPAGSLAAVAPGFASA